MLVSHRKKFIFIKTEKTAGTSVEAYFEPYCLPEEEWAFSGPRDQYVGETGIVGARGNWARHQEFYSHMPAHAIKSKVGSSVWENYYKFTIIRNPFDMIVSYFHHLETIFANTRFVDLPTRRKVHRLLWALQVPNVGESAERFRTWVRREDWLDRWFKGLYPGFVNNCEKYVINGDVCVDDFIQTEDIHAGIERVCSSLDIPYEPSRLPNLKSGNRPTHLDYKAYYDEATARIIADQYRKEIDMFDYEVPC